MNTYSPSFGYDKDINPYAKSAAASALDAVGEIGWCWCVGTIRTQATIQLIFSQERDSYNGICHAETDQHNKLH